MRIPIFFLQVSVIIIALAFMTCPVNAQDETRFFENLPDVPMLAGLEELSEFNISYDKPQGRITESLASIKDNVSNAEIWAFYTATMPQLGWSRINDMTYERGEEQLEFKIDSEGGHRFLRVMVRPR